MLRVYNPIENNPIFELHNFAKHLVCDIWCESDENYCLPKIEAKYNIIVNAYDWLKESIVEIDLSCEGLTPLEKFKIKQAFFINNDIENLCNGKLPIYLNQLPEVVENKMKPLFVKFYEELLNRTKVSGDKLEFYIELYKANRFTQCPCCGYMPFDTGQLDRREAYDHYLPKSKYPFASVNFKNLVPLCYKCNSDHKKADDPIENGRKVFYPYRNKNTEIEIQTNLVDGFTRSLYEIVVNNVDEENLDIVKIKEIEIALISKEQEQVDAWDDLFTIKGRFSERSGQFSFSLLKKMKRRYNEKKKENSKWKFEDTLDYYIGDYANDAYLDEKYLKIPFLKSVKNCDSILSIYS